MPTPETPITVESCLAELREMFPGATNTIIVRDEPFERTAQVKVGYRITTRTDLAACMAQVRRWKDLNND